ncbi:reverse transcriptase domain-containing protein, partial [Tanacetum coccineum]
YAKEQTEIHGIKRRQNEDLQAFMDRFKSESSHIKGVPLILRISAFMHGYGHLKLAKKLNDKIPKTVDEMFKRVRAFIRGEVAAGDRGHNTNDCYQLKKKIWEAVALGKLAQFVKDIRRNNQQNGNQGRNGVKIMNMIREEGNHKRPFEEGRILVDGGSSSEIMYEHCFRNLDINVWSRLKRCKDPMIVRTKMRSLEVVGSTIHSMIKFLTNQRVVTMETSKETMRECKHLEKVQGSWKEVQWRQHEEQMSRIREQAILRARSNSRRRPGAVCDDGSHIDNQLQAATGRHSMGKHGEDDGIGLSKSKRTKRGNTLGGHSNKKQNKGGKVPWPHGKETIKEGSGVGIILVSHEEKMHSYVIRLKFNASNHVMDCEALLAGLAASTNQGMKDLHVFIDSLTLVAQVEGSHTPATEQERKYKKEILDATALFHRFQIIHLPRILNLKAEVLTGLATIKLVFLNQEVAVGIKTRPSVEEARSNKKGKAASNASRA